MNRIQLYSWLYGSESLNQVNSMECFNVLRSGIAQGKKFPFDCPYQVALIHNPIGSEWLVAILVMRGTPGDDSIEQANLLKNWIYECGGSTGEDRIGQPVFGDTIKSSFSGRGWDYIDSFGSIQEKNGVGQKTEPVGSEKSRGKSWWQFWR